MKNRRKRLKKKKKGQKKPERVLKSPDVLLEFIPGYRADLEKQKSKTEEFTPVSEEEFKNTWIKEKLDKKLEKLRQALGKKV